MTKKDKNEINEFRSIKQYREYYYPNTKEKEVTIDENPRLFGKLLAKKALKQLEKKTNKKKRIIKNKQNIIDKQKNDVDYPEINNFDFFDHSTKYKDPCEYCNNNPKNNIHASGICYCILGGMKITC